MFYVSNTRSHLIEKDCIVVGDGNFFIIVDFIGLKKFQLEKKSFR